MENNIDIKKLLGKRIKELRQRKKLNAGTTCRDD